MKRFLLMITIVMGFMVGNAQESSGDNQQRKLIYCSCAYRTSGLPVGEISYSYYALTADIGTDPYVTYSETRGDEPDKKNYPVTEADVEEMYELITKLEVKKLNGYDAIEEMPGVTTYRIHVEWADGTQATANWTNHAGSEKAATAYNSILSKLSAISARKREK